MDRILERELEDEGREDRITNIDEWRREEARREMRRSNTRSKRSDKK